MMPFFGGDQEARAASWLSLAAGLLVCLVLRAAGLL